MVTLHSTTLEKRLALATAITGVIVIAEVIGGILSNSLALLSDSGHAFADTVALLLALFGIRQARRQATSDMTFGYHRVGIITALANGAILFVIAGSITFEALLRLKEPQPVQGPLMFTIAIIGLAANLTVAFLLRSFQGSSLNARAAFFNVLGDTLGSIGVILAGIVITLTGLRLIDPLVSLFIVGIILFGVITIIRDGLSVLLEASPKGLSVEEMLKAMQTVTGVKGIHDLHVWSIAQGIQAVSCHIQIDEVSVHDAADIREKIATVLRNRYEINHSTLQLECEHTAKGDLYCSILLGAHPKENGSKST